MLATATDQSIIAVSTLDTIRILAGKKEKKCKRTDIGLFNKT